MPRKRSYRKETGALQHNGLLYHYIRDSFGRVEVHRHAETIVVFNYEWDDVNELKQEARRRLTLKEAGTRLINRPLPELPVNQCFYSDDYNQDIYPL